MTSLCLCKRAWIGMFLLFGAHEVHNVRCAVVSAAPAQNARRAIVQRPLFWGGGCAALVAAASVAYMWRPQASYPVYLDDAELGDVRFAGFNTAKQAEKLRERHGYCEYATEQPFLGSAWSRVTTSSCIGSIGPLLRRNKENFALEDRVFSRDNKETVNACYMHHLRKKRDALLRLHEQLRSEFHDRYVNYLSPADRSSVCKDRLYYGKAKDIPSEYSYVCEMCLLLENSVDFLQTAILCGLMHRVPDDNARANA